MIRIAHFSSPEANDFMDKIDRRGQFENLQVQKIVSEILQDVKLEGNKAVVKYIEKYDSDQVDKENLRVTKKEFTEANGMVDSDFVSAINEAKKNIQRFHQRQIRQSWFTTEDSGVILGHLIRPLNRVGVCVPSVSQLLVSSLLMNVLSIVIYFSSSEQSHNKYFQGSGLLNSCQVFILLLSIRSINLL